MDTSKILIDLRAERDRINQAISALEALEPLGNASFRRTATTTLSLAARPRRRRMSAAARKRISEAAKKRWAEQKGRAALAAQAAPKKPRGRRRMSAAARKRIAEAQRKRWATQRKAAAKKVLPKGAKKRSFKKPAPKRPPAASSQPITTGAPGSGQ